MFCELSALPFIRLLTYDPKQRITAREALNHPYFTQEMPPAQVFHRLSNRIPETILRHYCLWRRTRVWCQRFRLEQRACKWHWNFLVIVTRHSQQFSLILCSVFLIISGAVNENIKKFWKAQLRMNLAVEVFSKAKEVMMPTAASLCACSFQKLVFLDCFFPRENKRNCCLSSKYAFSYD